MTLDRSLRFVLVVLACWCGMSLGVAPTGPVRVYVEPFPPRQGAQDLRDALIARLRKLHDITLVNAASEATATLHGEGEVWIKGYRSLNPRSGRLPSNGKPVYGGFLSVELTGVKGETLWSDLASENASEDVFGALAGRIAKHWSEALEAKDGPAAGVAHADAPVMLRGAGATFPAPIYGKWFTAYERQGAGVAIAYDAVGSEEGAHRLLDGRIDFGACDHPEIFRTLAGARAADYVLVPSVVGAVVPIVNLPGLTGEINLTPDALAGIYLGTITRWNDAAIAQANHGLTLPTLAITVVHRAEGSGTTYTWTDYLSKVSAAWRTRVGVTASPTWPVGQSANDNEGVARRVTQTPGAIGYVEFIYAVHAHLSYARVRNRHGTFISASLESIGAAAASGGGELTSSIVDPAGADAYPIASFTWLVVPARIADDGKRAALTGFLHWMLASGQRQAAMLGYLALPRAVASKAEAEVGRIARLESQNADAPVAVATETFERQSSRWGARRLEATIWYPTSGRGPFPLIVYSHGGCGGAPQAIAPIAKAIAAAGFIFVQFPHPGSTTDDCAAEGERYTRALLERPDDITYVIDALATLNGDASWRLHGMVDASRVGIIGHSQGGQTALMMPARDARVKATLSISPSVAHADTPPDVWQAIAQARVPVMIVHGSNDAQWTSEGPLKAYASLPADTPRAYLEVEGMSHTPGTPADRALVLRYATAFFRKYLQGDTGATAVLAPAAAPAHVSIKSAHFPQ